MIQEPLNVVTKEVTPEYASELLANNPMNRKLTDMHVRFLAKQIKEGKYMQTGDTIKISKTQRLLDGQHRLNAVVLANTPVIMNIAFGLDDDIFNVLDTGKVRSSSDILSVKGFTNSNELSSVARTLIGIETGYFSSSRKNKITNKDILELVQDRPELLEIVSHVMSHNKKFKMQSNSNISALYYIFDKLDTEACDKFFEKYFTGIDCTKGDPIHLLREMLIKDATSKSKLKVKTKMELTVVAWNAFRKGKQVSRLSWEGEKFPIAI